MQDAALAGAKVCGMQANREGFLQRYPAAASLHVSVQNADAALAGIDSGICEVAVVTADEWALRSKLESNCDKLMHVGVLFEKENAYAVRGDLQAPISWAMTKLLNRGAYASARSMAQTLYVGSIMSECAVNDYAENSWAFEETNEQDFFVIGPVFFTVIVITVAMLWFVATDVWEHRQTTPVANASNFKAVTDQLLKPPSLWKRISCRSMTESEQESRAALQKVGNSSDIKMIASMIKSRHITMARTCDVIKPDSPLSIADVPMLIELLKEAANEKNHAHGGNPSVSEVIAGADCEVDGREVNGRSDERAQIQKEDEGQIEAKESDESNCRVAGTTSTPATEGGSPSIAAPYGNASSILIDCSARTTGGVERTQ